VVNDGELDSTKPNSTVAVISVNDAAVAANDSYSVNEDEALTKDAATGVLSNDSDVDSASFTANLVTNTAHGALTLNANGSFTYMPDANYNGPDTFTYKANDGSLDSDEATVSITVNAVNDAPSFTEGTNQAVDEDSGAQSVPNWAINISAGPANESTQTVSFIVTNDNNALFSTQPDVDSNGSLTYRSAPDTYGSATVTVKAKDDGGTANGGQDTSALRTFTITVNPVNDAPGISNITNKTIEKDTSTGPIPFSVWDAETPAGDLTVAGSSDNPALVPNTNIVFAGSGANRTVRVAPASGQSGTVTITVRVSDGVPTTHSFVLTVEDTVSPTVKSVTPLNGQTGVGPTTNVYASFSEAMKPGTINKMTFKLLKKGTTKPVAATVRYDALSKKAILDPSVKLVRGATYVAQITTAAKDLAGNPLAANKTWQFRIK
jgi:VCBS repeat-containing protein